jgi:hypothetical protein
MKKKEEAWKWFSIYVRLKHADNYGYVNCYTCGRRMFWKKDGCQAGHFQGGRGNAVLLDEEQVRPQCYACNCGRSGEQYIFGKNLEREYGEKKVQEMRKKRHLKKKVNPKEWEQFASYYQLEAVKIATNKFLEI